MTSTINIKHNDELHSTVDIKEELQEFVSDQEEDISQEEKKNILCGTRNELELIKKEKDITVMEKNEFSGSIQVVKEESQNDTYESVFIKCEENDSGFINEMQFEEEQKYVVQQTNVADACFQKNATSKSNRSNTFENRETIDEKDLYLNNVDKINSSNLYVEKIQTGEKPFKCDVCEKSFGRRHSLKIHALIHTGEKPFKCNTCEKSFKQKAHLTQHILIHNEPSSNSNSFACDICGKTFTQLRRLKRHAMIHTEEKPLKCDKCEKRFKTKCNLNMHAMIHTGEKPFKCEVCAKSFTFKQDMKRHAAIHDVREKPFTCDVCGKSFALKFQLTDHSSIHTDEKSFKCEVCEKSFKRSNNLKRHATTHAVGRPFKCGIGEGVPRGEI